ATSTGIKAAAITFAAIGTFFLWFVAILVIRHDSAQAVSSDAVDDPRSQLQVQDKDAFAFAIELSGVSERKTLSGIHYWVAYESGHGATVSPADIFMFLTLVNLQPVPSTISRLRIEMKLGEDGGWIKLNTIPLRGGHEIFFGNDLSHIRRIDMTQNGIDYLL